MGGVSFVVSFLGGACANAVWIHGRWNGLLLEFPPLDLILCSLDCVAFCCLLVTISQDYSWSGIDVKIDAGVLDSFVNVQPRTNLCTLETITYIPTESEIANGTDTNIYCPSAGKYQMYWSFTVPKGGGDAQLQYTPDFRIKYYSTLNNTTLGCAGTGTGATVRQAELHKKEGEIALGAALTALFGVFGICLCLAYRRKKLVEMGDEDAWQRKRSSARHAAAHEGSTTLTDLDERYEVSSEPSDDYYYHDGSESQPREKYMMNGDSSLPEHQREQPTQSSIDRFSSPGRGAYEQHGSDHSQISSIPFPGETETVESSLPSIEWAPPSSTRLPTSIRRF